MYVIKNDSGKYLAKIDHDGITFSSFVEEAIASRDRNDLVHLFDFLCGYSYSYSVIKIVTLSKSEENDFFGF